jgi:hypothetical protein
VVWRRSQLRPSLFWGITQRRLEGSYRRFGKTYRSPLSTSSSLRPDQAILDCLTLEEGIDRFLRNANNYKSALCNTPEEQRSHLNSGGSLKSHDHMSCKLLWRIRTRIRDKRPGVRIPLQAMTFLSSKTPRLTVGSIQPLIQWKPGFVFKDEAAGARS